MQESETPVFNDPANAPAMSLGGRLGNIFVSPGEVFDEVKASPPQPANWLVPMVIGMIVGIIYSFVVFSQPQVIQKFKDAQDKGIQKMIDQGKLTREQADASEGMREKFMTPVFFEVIGILMSVIAGPAMLFIFGGVIWLIGKYGFKGDFDYMKAVEAVGLCGMISILDTVVMMLLAVIFGDSQVSPGPALFISHFDPTIRNHLLLAAVDVVWLWYLAVLAIALSRLSGTSFVKAALWGYGLWAVPKLALILISGAK